MAIARTLGLRRTMSPNQIVAYNVAKARLRRGWTQEEAAEALAPYLGTRLSSPASPPSSGPPRTPTRVKVFSADELLALSRGLRPPHRLLLHPTTTIDRHRSPRPRRRPQRTRPDRAARRRPRHPRPTGPLGTRAPRPTPPAPPPPPQQTRKPTSLRRTWPNGSNRSVRSTPKHCCSRPSATSTTPATSSNGSPRPSACSTTPHLSRPRTSRHEPAPSRRPRPRGAPAPLEPPGGRSR